MLRKIGFVVLVLALALITAVPVLAGNGRPDQAFGPKTEVTVYVESQGLSFDSIVGPALPQQGPFQELRPGEGPGGTLATDFGPGDPGYVGGRWWVDENGNGEMDDEDTYFSCPLLGPGYPL